MCERASEIEAQGASLAFIGNGNPTFARAFQEDLGIRGPVLVDPELRSYRAAGMRRGRVEVLSPRMASNALRALRGGARQRGVQGDPWQLGGVFVVRPGGALAFAQRSREAGDHPPVEEVLAALDPSAPAVDETPPAPSPALGLLSRGLSLVLDPSIALSFDRTGFAVHALGFDPSDLDVDLSGRRCVVTGANSGIGFETALGLADLGAEVVLLCRNAERGEAAVEAIREATGSRLVSLEQADLSDLASVRRAASRLAEGPVDVLVHNAGLLPDERQLTAQGLELTFATHVAGPFLLTRMLRERLEQSRDGRVVWVSSGGMYTRRLDLRDLEWSEREYDGVLAYAQTKRAQVVLAELWAKELRGSGVSVTSMHPGWADTAAVQSSLPRFHALTRRILRTPAQGADTLLWLAAGPRAKQESGRFYFDRKARSPYLVPGTREDEAERRALWRTCQELADEAATLPGAA